MAKKSRPEAQGHALSIVRVPFKDGWIEAARDEAGVVWVPLRRFCDLFGLGYSSQLQKLKAKTWGTVTTNRTVAEDGKPREMVMIDDTTFAMWLATLELSRVKAELRPHLEEHQREGARALRAYFFPASAPTAAATPAALPSPDVGAAREVLERGAPLDDAQRAAVEALARIAERSALPAPAPARHRDALVLLEAAETEITQLKMQSALARIRGAIALLRR